ncbi:transposase [Gandjariella thermophila]|uniref:transposase n=1 Tax=Gandjariella thermophila TaxID=1931992 RepID=UPI001863B5FD
MATHLVSGKLAGHPGYHAIQIIPGIGPTLAAVFVAEAGEVTRFASAHLFQHLVDDDVVHGMELAVLRLQPAHFQ